MINDRVKELASELFISFSMKLLSDWVDSVSGLASSLCVFTSLKSDAFTEVVFLFDLLLSELVCSDINKGVDKLIIK